MIFLSFIFMVDFANKIHDGVYHKCKILFRSFPKLSKNAKYMRAHYIYIYIYMPSIDYHLTKADCGLLHRGSIYL